MTISHIQTLAIPKEEVKLEETTMNAKDLRTLTEVLSHSKEPPNFFFSYYKNRIFKIGIGINCSQDSSKDNRSDFEIKQLSVVFTNPLVKMKWFYLKKFDKTVAIFIDVKGNIM